MDTLVPAHRAPRAVVLLGGLCLLASSGSLQAQDRDLMDAEAGYEESAPSDLAPADVTLEAAFAPYNTPVEPVLLDHAVDITTIEPAAPAARPIGGGVASYYGRRFHGRLTANGERFDMHAMTAAHRTLPFGTRVRVTNPRNGRSVVVRINDRGPFVGGRTIDLSRGAAERIGMISRGHARVELEILED